MKVEGLHPWKVDPSTARRIQESLKDKLVLKLGKSFHPRLIAANPFKQDKMSYILQFKVRAAA